MQNKPTVYIKPWAEEASLLPQSLVCESPDIPGQNYGSFWDFVDEGEREF